MPVQVLTNIFIGVLWMFFQDNWGALTFLTGYLFGLFIIFLLRGFLRSKFYLFTMQAVVNLIVLFIYEILTSSIAVIKRVLKPKLDIKPGIISFRTSLEGDIEVTLLALLTTLTPGSVVMEISPDNKILYAHAMDIPELSDSVLRSVGRFEKAIKKVTRP